ncbi:MAG: ACP S-malonyltransferase [Planctomycetota bacterium]
MVGCIFAGQGSQFVGMGTDLSERFPVAAQVYRRSEEVLGYSIAEVSFNGPQEKLSQTAVQQPAILTMSVAVLRVLEETGKLSPVGARATCGLSLGEYSALVFAGSLSFEDALTLVAKRGELMEAAGRERPGGMLSVIGLETQEVERLCAEAAEGQTLVLANLNCPGQVVISGDLTAVERAERIASDRGATRLVRLQVSGAFHSPLMESAQRGLAEALRNVEIRAPRVAFIANATGAYETSPERVRELLVRQIGSPVLWQKSMELLLADGVDRFVELGPGTVLRGLLKRISPDTECASVGTVETVEKL